MDRSRHVVSRRSALVWCGVGAGVPIVQACAGAAGSARSGSAPSGPLAGGRNVTLQALYSSQNQEDREVFVKVFQAFHDHSPNVAVNFIDISLGDLPAKATTMMAAGTPPDVMYLHPSFVLSFVRAKQLVDLTDTARNDKALYIPAQLDFWSDKGRLFGLPFNSNPSLMYFNKTIFQRYGVKTPDVYAKEGNWTWQTLREVAKLTSGGEGALSTFGYDPGGAASLQFYTCVPIWDNDGELTNKEETAWLLDTAPVVEVMQWHADMHLRELSIPMPGDDIRKVAAYPFSSGRIAMAIGGKNRALELAAAPFEIGQVGTPKGKVGPFNRDGPLGSGLPVGGQNADAAYALGRFIGSAEAAPIYLGTGRGLPVQKALVDAPVFKAALKPFEQLEVYKAAAATVRAWRFPGKANEAQQALNNEWNKVLTGQQNVLQAMRSAKAAMDPLLA